MSDVQIWRYDLPTVSEQEIAEYPWLKGEHCQGWATIIIGSDGFFAAVSDRGNYAYRWYIPERDMREFLLESEDHPDSFIAKLSPSGDWPYNGPETFAAVKKYLRTNRNRGYWDKCKAKFEASLLDKHEKLANQMVFWDWCRETKISDPHEFEVRKPANDVTCFVTKTMRRLCVVLRKELDLLPKGERDEQANSDRVDRAG